MSVEFQSWSRSSAVSPQVTEAINPAVGCHYFPPGPRLPPQLPSITAHWSVPNYTAWWQRHMFVNNLRRVAHCKAAAGIQTRDVFNTSDSMFYPLTMCALQIVFMFNCLFMCWLQVRSNGCGSGSVSSSSNGTVFETLSWTSSFWNQMRA